jgi:hypothetical protein
VSRYSYHTIFKLPCQSGRVEFINIILKMPQENLVCSLFNGFCQAQPPPTPPMGELRQAIDSDELVLHFQPKVTKTSVADICSSSGRIERFALVQQ